MIKKTDKLFDFIQSMTAHERGYFKQNSNKNSYYVILFDAICKQHEYNEQELIRILKKNGCSRKISAIKDYLWQELTQAMAPYHLIRTPVGEALSQMQRLHLMSNKGLSGHIHKELESLKKLCTRYELFDTLIQVMHFEFKFGFNELALEDRFWQEFHDTVYSNMIHMNLSEIQHKLYVIKLKHQDKELSPYHTKEVEQLINHKAMKDKLLNNSVRLRIIKEGILDLYAYLINDYEGMLRHNMNIVSLLESKPHLLKDGRELSFIYTNIVTSLANAGQRQQLAGVIDHIINRFKHIDDHHTDTIGHLLEIKLIRTLVFNDFTELKELQSEFLDTTHKFPVSIKHKLYYYFIAALIKDGQLLTALDWIANALAFYRKHKHVSAFYLDKLKVVHILLHYQLGNIQYVTNQIESFKRTYVPSVKKEKDVNSQIIKLLSTALRSSDEAAIRAKTEKAIQTVPHSESDMFIDLYVWLITIIDQKDYTNESAKIAQKELSGKPVKPTAGSRRIAQMWVP